MSDDPQTRIEERLAEALKTIDEMSDEMARQGKSITRLEARVAMLMEREARREADGGGGIVIGDERPPHY